MGLSERQYMQGPPDPKAIARVDAAIELGQLESLPQVEQAWVGQDGTIRVVYRLAARGDDQAPPMAMVRRVPTKPHGPVPQLRAAAPLPD